MFLDWKNLYCEKNYTTQSNVQIQRSPCHITKGIFYRTRTNSLKICMETQKTLNSQSNLEEKNGAEGIRLPDFRLYYKSTSNQDNMVLAQKQKYRSMKQDRKPRDKPTHLWSTNL